MYLAVYLWGGFSCGDVGKLVEIEITESYKAVAVKFCEFFHVENSSTIFIFRKYYCARNEMKTREIISLWRLQNTENEKQKKTYFSLKENENW